ISYRNAEVGSYLTAGSKVLTLVDNSHIYVDCSLSEADAAVLETGMNVNVTVDALGQNFPGKLVFVSPAMGDDSKTFMVRISLEADSSVIKSGLFARSAIDILQKRNTLFVPKEAILTKNGRTSVYVYDESTETVQEKQVTIGLMNDTEAEIVEGLSEGELVVTSGQDRLQNDMRVKVKETAAKQEDSAGEAGES
uniref:efflux RND transporter periplasmic adaptor subunit n=1 Tax=Anaerovibrio slackiae TaxID=2652309 RepID=UPI0038662C59